MEVAERLVLLAYDAPLHPEGWTPFLEALRAETRSRAASFKWGLGASVTLVSAGIGDDALRLYGERFAALDPWASVALSPGDDVFGDEMIGRPQVENTDYYGAFGRPHGFVDIHKVVLGRGVSLGLLKSERTKVSARERRLTQKLAPHLSRALTLSTWANDLRTTRTALSDALDNSATASFLLDADGYVTFASRAAERILSAADGLRVHQRRLQAIRPDEDRRLQAHLANVSSPTAPVIVRRHVVLAQPREGGGALVFVRSRERAHRVLQERHGLTAAEARVAMGIGRGQSIRELATALGVSANTVRAQLRAVFAKTGVRRQAQLASFVHSLS